MSDAEKSLVVSLAEGVTETAAEEVAGGIVTRSENTRLSKLKGSVSRRAREDNIMTVSDGAVCGGLATGGRNSTVAYFKQLAGQRRIVGDVTGNAASSIAPETGQNAYYPYPMSGAGVVPGSSTLHAPAVAYDSGGRQWIAAVRYMAGEFGVYGLVTDSGEQLSSQLLVQLTTTLPGGTVLWVGLTPANDDMILWYAQDDGVYAARCTWLGIDLSIQVGTPVLVYAPLKPSFYVRGDVVSDGVQTAWLLTRSSSVSTAHVLLKVNLLSLSVAATVTLAGTTTSSTNMTYEALSYYDGRLAYTISDAAGYGNIGELDAVAMTTTWSDVTLLEWGAVAVQPFCVGADSWWVFCQQLNTTNITVAPTMVSFRRRVMGSGTLQGTAAAYWYALQSRGCYHAASTTEDALEVYPYFPCLPWWSVNSNGYVFPVARTDLVTPTERVIDPSIEVFTPYAYAVSESPQVIMTTVARFGVDRAALPILTVHSANACAVSTDGKMACTYIELRTDQSFVAQNGYASRYVELDLVPQQQPGVARDTGGVAMLASAYPACWDGLETTEACVPHVPRVVVDTSGTGASLTGEFLVTAVITFRDAAGNIHRSPPALPFPITLTADAARVFVTIPNTFRTGALQEEFDVTLYWTLDAGTIFYAHPDGVTNRGGNGGVWVFDSIRAPSDADVPLYSDGTAAAELLPQCPPPARDVRSIGGRYWLIDAENPYVVWPSKSKQEGYTVEFAGQLRITGFDPQYGELLAAVDVNGTPHFLAERGVWAVDGYGPNNAGQGQRFGDPRLVSSQGCMGRHTVAVIPEVGAMYQAWDGKMVLLGGGSKRLETFEPGALRAPTVHFGEAEVIYPRVEGGWAVYNWLMDAWTTWPVTVEVEPTCVLTVPQADGTQQTLVYYQDIGTLRSMRSDTTIEGSGPILVERGWIAPETPNGYCVIREVWVHARNEAAHNLTVDVWCDYDESGATVGGMSNHVQRTWAPAEITAITVDGRYTVGVTLEKTARAVKVRVTGGYTSGAPEGFTEGCQPLSVQVWYGVNAGARHRTLAAGAKK